MSEILSQIPWGLTFNGFSLLIIVWWIRGMPDRKRAETEKNKLDAEIMAGQYDRLLADVKRLQARIEVLEDKLEVKDTTIAELTALKLKSLAEHAAKEVLFTARDAENKHIIANLRMRLAGSEDQPLVAATEHVAEATERVANVAEMALKKG